MTHRFPIKEIARQAGLGTATVDRVLNHRPNVSVATRLRVLAAIDELHRIEAQLAARGRRLFIDLVIEAPRRFSDEIRRASQAVLPGIGVAVIRPRFLFQETMSVGDVVAALTRIARRGSDGVCLKARDMPAIAAAVDRLEDAGIPVATLVTDLPESRRSAYVGANNLAAGHTAAFLLAGLVHSRGGTILTSRSQAAFYGEAERFNGFRDELMRLRPDLRIVDLAGGAGLRAETAESMTAALERHPGPAAIYSMGGGNAAILDSLPAGQRHGIPFIAHDLDAENRALLRAGRIGFVLYHDLEQDMRNMFLALAARHGLGERGPTRLVSDVSIVTPCNLPLHPR